MDIGITLFPDYLPIILNDIASSCCVAIDFEFSGLAFPPSVPSTAAPTVQERYLEAKEAAERYQILQVGLTICHEDPKNVSYTLKPYNFNLSPITDSGNDRSRDWVFASRSMDFLLAQGFSIDTMCTSGIRYLSREEEESALRTAVERCRTRAPIPDLQVQQDDHECLEFLQTVRLAINNWLAEGVKRDGWLNIPPPTTIDVENGEIPWGLSNTQKRLVHQLISVEYPNLTSRGASTFIQIQMRNQESERRALEAKLTAKKQQIRDHIGFRWIVEALVGGNLDDLEPERFGPLLRKMHNPKLDVRQLSERVKGQLKKNRPVLVGHNMFSDLLFLYSCFIGPLPDTLEEFNTVIHGMFPMLADTKYMATHDCGIMARQSSLEDLNVNLAHLENPKIQIDTRFTKYGSHKRAHEAGYDSLLTAMAFIKLAGNIQRSSALFSPKKQSTFALLNGSRRTLFANATEQLHRHNLLVRDYLNYFGMDSEASTVDEVFYEELAEPNRSWKETGDRQITSLANRGRLVPRLGTLFWSNYGNKLRVFGTQEKLIQLGGGQGKEEMLIEF